jgi:porphobilinogen synthase
MLAYRPRRLRRGELIRDSFADVQLNLKQIVMPLFLRDGNAIKQEIASMPEVFQLSPDKACEEISQLVDQGISRFMLFGVVATGVKNETGSIAHELQNPVIQTIERVKKKNLNAYLIADLCYCEYTSHGHCGILSSDSLLTVDNDKTIIHLGKQAVVLAQHGADMIAPSGAMDGMVGAIRIALDEAELSHVPIMSYSVKYASHMYGPFRDAADGAPQFGDRRGYQMDFRRSREWLTEVNLDIAEGADVVMVKPAGPYLDILAHLRTLTELPICAYQVSGEYSMLHAAAQNGWLDLEQSAVELLYSIKRAGADMIITYFAPRLPKWL